MSTLWLSGLVLAISLAEIPKSPATTDKPATAPAVVSSPAQSATAKLDELIVASWKPLNIVAEPASSDATYLRRVWLDLAGRTPPLAEVEKFLDDKSPAKREELVDRLLKSKDFANHQARLWSEYLTDKRPFEQDSYDGRVLQAYLRDALLADKSYRQIVQDLLTGEGASDDSGPATFYLRYNVEPIQLAGAVSKKFLGLTLHCAQCHDHPHARWSKEEFWGLAAFFGRLRKMQPDGENDDDFTLVMERKRGELQVPDTAAKPGENGEIPKKSVYPRLPQYTDARGARSSAKPGPSPNRRATLAQWLTADQNPYFARHAVNRVWQSLYGSALVASFDHLAEEPASLNKSILDLLAADFQKSNYDLKKLLKTIVLSEAYQRASGIELVETPPPQDAKPDSKADELRYKQLQHYARFPVRPLNADQLYLSIVQATGFRGGEEESRLAETTGQDYVTDLPGTDFGDRPLTVNRTLAMLNGDYVQQAVGVATASANRRHGPVPGTDHIRWLILSTLSRYPTAEETDHLLELAATGEQGFEDVVWVILNSAEFGTNH